MTWTSQAAILRNAGPVQSITLIKYFGYGSNMNFISLRAKGVVPSASRAAVLNGWRLEFNVEHFFRHEGGVGNIECTGGPADRVLGVLHCCDETDLAALDRMEAYGVGYDRVEVTVETELGTERALAYVGLPEFVNDACRPTRRYLNILSRGAAEAGLDPAYIAALDARPVLPPRKLSPFQPAETGSSLDHTALAPHLTALAGSVFDMSGARPAQSIAKDWFGGKEVTLFLLKRLDTSDGSECLEDVIADRLRPDQRDCLNTYLHAFADEYAYVGRFDYTSLPDEKTLG
ncbi:MAG: gamma-glutamylcyclotransferase family protein [Paracoccaceae bacterium]